MPFWMYRKKALIQAELGDYKGAIASAKISMEGAEKANYQSYIDSNKLSIEEWSKKYKKVTLVRHASNTMSQLTCLTSYLRRIAPRLCREWQVWKQSSPRLWKNLKAL